MSENNNLESIRQAMYTFKALWIEKRYREDTMKILGIMAGSQKGHLKYGNTLSGFQRLIELTKECKNEQEVLNAFGDEIIN